VKSSVLLLLLVAAAGGAILGGFFSYQSYIEPGERFGVLELKQPEGPARVESIVSAYNTGKQAQGVPKIEVDGGNTFNFGTMLRNASGKHQFVVRNVGTADLVLQVGGTTCKCTVGTLSEGKLAPGKSTTVDLAWDAKTETRTFSQSATLRTNDPSKFELPLIVEGDVVDLLAAEPAEWNLGEIATAAPLELTTRLYNYSTETVTIEKLSWTSESFGAGSEIVIEPLPLDPQADPAHASASQAFDVKIKVAGGLPQGVLSQTLRARYKTPTKDDFSPLEMKLTGLVVGDLSVMGNSKLTTDEYGNQLLKLGEIDRAAGTEETFYVSFRGPFRDQAQITLGAVTPSEGIEAELGEPSIRGAVKYIPVIIRTKKDAPPMDRLGGAGRETGMLTIQSDRDEVAPLQLRVVFKLTQGRGS